ncbi:MAG TPA: plastocyanin/azurin family copper-binding protein [Solirubrobacterales bacterium]|nr:plastocyanin/azurin family copper-binding protein [Solirubrobacterales bacterium]
MKKFAVLLAMLLAAFAIVACGDSDSDTTSDTGAAATTETEEKAEEGGGSGELSFEADPDGALAYTTDEATADPGKLTVEFNNPAPVPHDVRFEDSSGKDIGGTEVITESSETTTVDLKPGKYTFFCSVPGHRQAGMEGTLTVG